MILVKLHGFESEIGDYGKGPVLGSLQGLVGTRMPTPTRMREYAEFIRLVADVMDDQIQKVA